MQMTQNKLSPIISTAAAKSAVVFKAEWIRRNREQSSDPGDRCYA